jgi:hypothetical protein
VYDLKANEYKVPFKDGKPIVFVESPYIEIIE